MKTTNNNNNNNNNIEFVDSISRSGSSSAITSVISLYKVNEFTVAENDDPSYTNLGFDAPIQAVKPNKAISEIVTPIEELYPIINTDMNKDMDIEMSRLRHENNLLQRNVNVLRDENVLLRDASQVLIIEFEKRVKPNLWDSSQKIHSETQINSQSEEHSSSLYSQPQTKSKEWKSYLDLVYRAKSSEPVWPTTLKR